jgi:hypothetical protein
MKSPAISTPAFVEPLNVETPLRAGPDHKFNFVGQGEWLFEENVGATFANAFAEHRPGADSISSQSLIGVNSMAAVGPKLKGPDRLQLPDPPISTIASGSFSSARACTAVKATTKERPRQRALEKCDALPSEGLPTT